MFKCDDILFKNSCIEIQDAKSNLTRLDVIIDELNSISDVYDGKSEVEDAILNLSNLTKEISDLYANMLNTLNIMAANLISIDGSLGLDTLGMPFEIFENGVVGEYGANQSDAYLLFKKYLDDPDSLSDIEKKRVDLINKVFDDYKYANLPDIVKKSILFAFHSGGCGPASITNIIIDKYARTPNGEKLFEEKYGFPLYYVDENGNKRYNYAPLHTKVNLDMVSDRLNFNFKDVLKLDGYDEERAYISFVDDVNTCLSSYTRFIGLTDSMVVYFLDSELKDDYNLSFKTDKYGNFMTMMGIGNNEFDEIVPCYKKEKDNHDYAIISVHKFALKPYGEESIEEFGEKKLTYDAGHFMVLNGISENGYPIVSSWGYKFELVKSAKTEVIYVDVGDKNE